MLIKKRFFFPSKRKLLLVFGLLVFSLLSFMPYKTDDPFNRKKQFCILNEGIQLAYVEVGKPEGRPLILLHGYTDTGRSFLRVAEQLLQRDANLRIIMPDLRGHGASSMPPGSECRNAPEKCFQIPDFAADILGLMAHLRIDRAHIAGHSMGSMIAQHIGVTHPEKVKSITLIATVVVGNASPVLHEFIFGELIEKQFRLAAEALGISWPGDAYHITPEALGDSVAGFLVDNWVTESVADSTLLKAISSETIRTNVGTWIGSARGIRDFDYRNKLQNLRVPTLILSAVQDPVPSRVPDDEYLFPALDIASQNGNPLIYHKMYGRVGDTDGQAPDLGHNFLWAVPESVAADILSFMNTNIPQQNHTYLNREGRVVMESSTHNILKWPRMRD